MRNKSTFIHPHEVAAKLLEETQGSLTHVQSGTVYHVGESSPWDMQRKWRGAELTLYSKRVSLWGNQTILRLYPSGKGTQAQHAFTLVVQGHIPDEDADSLAQVYMTALNAQRAE